MIRLTASLSKKMPIADVEFSSRQCGATIEVEVADQADPEDIRQRLRDLYGMMEEAVDAQLEGTPVPAPEDPVSRLSALKGDGKGGNGNGNGRRNGHASAAQVKAVFAISKDRGLSRNDLATFLREELGVERPEDLSVQQASDLIGRLQAMGKGAR